MNTRSLIVASGLLLVACLSDDPTAPDSSSPARPNAGPILAVIGSPPTDLGTLGGPESDALDINASGQIVGWSQTQSGQRHAFRWQGGVMTDLGTLSGTAASEASAISDAGHVVGSSMLASGTGRRAFLWQDGTMRALPMLPGYTTSAAFDVNSAGQVVGSSSDGARIVPTLWANGLVTALGNVQGSATGISAQGHVVGLMYSPDGSPHAFLYINGTMRDLGTLGARSSHAAAINAYDQVVGMLDLGSLQDAFLWEGGTMRDLGRLNGNYSSAGDINDNGQVVGQAYVGGSSIEGTAFVWYNGVMSGLLALGGASQSGEASGINAAGQVVGSSPVSLRSETHHAVRWTLPPVNFWSSRSALPSARRDAAVVAVNGLIYTIGGVNSTGTALRTVSLYNPNTDAWSTGVSLPAARQAGTGAALIGGLLYVAGGYDAAGALSRTLYAYNLTSKTWSTKASLPIPGGCGGSGVISGKLYVFTGCTRASTGVTTRVGRLHRYDPATNTWTTLATAPAAHYYPAVTIIGGKLYVAGGIDGAGATSRRLDVYNPSTNTWSTKASLPTARRGAAGAALGGRLHVFGGLSGSTYLKTVEAYDPVTNFWVPRAALASARSGFGVGVVGGKGYAIGGRNSTSSLSTNTRYTP